MQHLLRLLPFLPFNKQRYFGTLGTKGFLDKYQEKWFVIESQDWNTLPSLKSCESCLHLVTFFDPIVWINLKQYTISILLLDVGCTCQQAVQIGAGGQAVLTPSGQLVRGALAFTAAGSLLPATSWCASIATCQATLHTLVVRILLLYSFILKKLCLDIHFRVATAQSSKYLCTVLYIACYPKGLKKNRALLIHNEDMHCIVLHTTIDSYPKAYTDSVHQNGSKSR